jgi:hypothetical protein
MKTMKTKISALTPLAIGVLIGALTFMADTRVCLAAPVVVVNAPVVTVAKHPWRLLRWSDLELKS